MILEWEVPFTLTTPEGSLPFNQLVSVGDDALGFYLLDRSKCSAGSARRITRQNLAQADGEITKRKFRTGYVFELNAQLWQVGTDDTAGGAVPACEGALRELGDLLDLHLNAIENTDGSLTWQPTPWPSDVMIAERAAYQLRSLGPSGQNSDGEFVSVAVEEDAESPLVDVTFALITSLPYYMDAAESDTDITSGGTLDNTGNADFFGVLEVYGPTNGFTITNTSVTDEAGNPLQITYDASLPGASSILSGHYVEIDLFRNTVYLDGNSSNYKPGINVEVTDFWPLVPGSNVITVSDYTGAQIVMKWQPAYV